MNRRQFLQFTGIAATSSLVSIAPQAWVARTNAASPNPKRLIVVFLRGAVDGLNVVVPYREAEYYSSRPRIAIPKPGEQNGAIALDGQFGLHPALSPLLPLWQQKKLAFVHACGSPDPSRSHFDAQYFMEAGTPGKKTTSDGWMNRLMAVLADRNPIQAVSVSATTPQILAGRMPVAMLAPGRATANRLPIDRPQVAAAFDQLYSGSDTLSQTYQEGRESRAALLKNLEAEMQMANNGAPLPNSFASDAQKLARVMARDRRVELGFLAIGGWDTHVNQGSSQGQLARNLTQLGHGLATLQTDLGAIYADTTILVMSEFGRTLRENGNAGTDHGHGNVMWVMGGNVHGGKVYGDWRGLAANQLYEGRDLPVTTDFRDVVMTVLKNHLGLDQTKLNQVFPSYVVQQQISVV